MHRFVISLRIFKTSSLQRATAPWLQLLRLGRNDEESFQARKYAYREKAVLSRLGHWKSISFINVF